MQNGLVFHGAGDFIDDPCSGFANECDGGVIAASKLDNGGLGGLLDGEHGLFQQLRNGVEVFGKFANIAPDQSIEIAGGHFAKGLDVVSLPCAGKVDDGNGDQQLCFEGGDCQIGAGVLQVRDDE